MARDTRLTPYNEQFSGPFDEDVNDPEFLAYEPAPMMAPARYAVPEEPMPLFLSGDAAGSRRRGFGTGGETTLNRVALWPRILKAGIFAAVAAAIASAIVSVENPLALFANAKASLMSSASEQTGTTPKSDPQPAAQPAAPVQLASSSPPTQAVPAAVAVAATPPTVKVTPTRDDIALALRSAQQPQTEAVQPPPAAAAAAASPVAVAVAAPPVRRLDADELAALLKRAKSLIAIGDIASARLLLERAADAREASAALMLAQTYDPAVLGTPDMRSITPDPAMARDWYQKAAQLGSLDARQRLAQMQK
jgi:hypothetical protein